MKFHSLDTRSGASEKLVLPGTPVTRGSRNEDDDEHVSPKFVAVLLRGQANLFLGS